MRTIRDIIIGVVFGGAVAFGGVWLYYQYHDYKEEIAEAKRIKNEARKAHRDSLMQIRKNQEESLIAENDKEIRQKVVIRFLTEFYENAFFADKASANSYRCNLTDNCLRKLQGTNDDGSPNGHLAWNRFLSGSEKPDIRSLRRFFRITPEEDGWYRVHLVEGGITTYRHLKIVLKGNQILIDDMK